MFDRKEYMKKYREEYYQKHKEQHKELRKKYYQEHKEQERINKAIELLNDWDYLDKIDCYCEPKEVIDILKGEK